MPPPRRTGRRGADLLHLVVRELALALDEPLALLRVRVVEARGDLGLFVLERDVAREDVACAARRRRATAAARSRSRRRFARRRETTETPSTRPRPGRVRFPRRVADRVGDDEVARVRAGLRARLGEGRDDGRVRVEEVVARHARLARDACVVYWSRRWRGAPLCHIGSRRHAGATEVKKKDPELRTGRNDNNISTLQRLLGVADARDARHRRGRVAMR